jgi:hypothetical protein
MEKEMRRVLGEFDQRDQNKISWRLLHGRHYRPLFKCGSEDPSMFSMYSIEADVSRLSLGPAVPMVAVAKPDQTIELGEF